jgi:hypothetical protein
MKHGERRRDSKGCSYFAHVDLTSAAWYPEDLILEVYFKEYEGLHFYGSSASSIQPYLKQGESYEAFAQRFIQCYDSRIYGNTLPRHPRARIVAKAQSVEAIADAPVPANQSQNGKSAPQTRKNSDARASMSSTNSIKHGERRRDSQGCSYYAHVDLTHATWYPKDQIPEVHFKEYEGLKFYGFAATSIQKCLKQGESYAALARRFVQDYDLRIFGNILPKHPRATVVPKNRSE